MSDENATGTPAQVEAEVTPEPTPEIDWKSKAREWERRAKENKAAADELSALRESQKSEAEKSADRLREAEQRARAAELTVLRQKVALDEGVPASLVDRLQGDTEDELRQDAATLMALVRTPHKPAPDPSQGGRGEPLPGSTADVFASATANF